MSKTNDSKNINEEQIEKKSIDVVDLNPKNNLPTNGEKVNENSDINSNSDSDK